MKTARSILYEERENVTGYACAKEDPSDYGTGKIWVDKDSIINAPNIELP